MKDTLDCFINNYQSTSQLIEIDKFFDQGSEDSEIEVKLKGDYPRYWFSCQDAKTSSSVLRWVQLPPPEVELIRKRGGEDHSYDVKVARLLWHRVTPPQTRRYLQDSKPNMILYLLLIVHLKKEEKNPLFSKDEL